MNPILLGALTGAAFGAVLAASGLSNPRLIVGMLRLEDLRLLKLLVTAIGMGIVGVALLDYAGAAHLGVKPLHLIALVVGGALFGVGFAVSGYCPGTSLAAIAEGRRDAIFTAAGGLLGAGAFAFGYETLRPLLIDPMSFGSPTLHSWLGVPGLVMALPFGAAAACAVALWLRAEAKPLRLRSGRGVPPGRGGRREAGPLSGKGAVHDDDLDVERGAGERRCVVGHESVDRSVG